MGRSSAVNLNQRRAFITVRKMTVISQAFRLGFNNISREEVSLEGVGTGCAYSAASEDIGAGMRQTAP